MFKKIFSGRYGLDDLGFALILAAMLLSFNQYTRWLGLLILAWAFYRMLSRRTDRRYAELQAYKSVIWKARRWFSGIWLKLRSLLKPLGGLSARWKQRKDYAFIKCPGCKNTLRLPKNKGKLSVTCPVCKNAFITRT